MQNMQQFNAKYAASNAKYAAYMALFEIVRNTNENPLEIQLKF